MKTLSKLALLPLAAVIAMGALPSADAGPVITDINTDLARYTPGSGVTIYVELTNNTGSGIINGSFTVYCKHLGTLLATLPAQHINLAAGAKTSLTFSWTPPNQNYQGYSLEGWARSSSGSVLDDLNTAVDVSSTWSAFPRYGFFSGYPSQSTQTSINEAWQLKNYHINSVQFYDWEYKDENPLAGTVSSPSASWNDIAGRPTYRQTVLDMINGSHTYGMAAMNYNLIYGAWSGYGADNVSYLWGLWANSNTTNQECVSMPSGWSTPYIYFFNPANSSWQTFIYGQESNVFAAYPFDGWQIDEVGNRGTTYDASGNPVTVWQTFRPFINNAKTSLNKTLIFNNVGAYGLNDVAANSTEDCVYIECWESSGQTSYNDLRTVIGQGSTWSGGKGVILAAYMDLAYGGNFSKASPGTFNTPGVLLTDATIFASGASHIELGDGAGMLDNEYFPNHDLAPSSALQSSLLNYYDFDVANENILRAGAVQTSNAFWCSVANSNNATPNTVWGFTSTAGGYQLLNLINLMGESSNAWRDTNATYPAPTTQSNFTAKYYYGSGTVNSVNVASPDISNGIASSLAFTTGSDGGGNYVQFVVPSLYYWDMIYISVSPAA